MKAFDRDVHRLLRQRRIQLQVLQSFTGRTGHIANLLYAWRPFISELWAAITERKKAGDSRVWVKQIIITLQWLSVFLNRHRGSLIRSWKYSAWLYPQTTMTMILDASPYGLGGVLVSAGRIISWFASPLTHLDEQTFHHDIGADSGQQVWEALCILVALRVWKSKWATQQCTLTVKSDNISALVMASRLKITSSKLISQEIALELSEAAFMPRHVIHVPGVMNVWADALSRLSDPRSHYRVPAQLVSVARAFPARRSPGFYSTLAAEQQGGR